MHIDLAHKTIEYDIGYGVSLSGDLENKDIELDVADFRMVMDISNNEIDFYYDDDMLLREPLPSRNTIYDFFLSFRTLFCFCFSCQECDCCFCRCKLKKE